MRKSQTYIHMTGRVPKTWKFDSKLSAIAETVKWKLPRRYSKAHSKVYRRPGTTGSLGRCFYQRNIIVLRADANLHVLAHEVAHFAYKSHGIKHKELAEYLYGLISKLHASLHLLQ